MVGMMAPKEEMADDSTDINYYYNKADTQAGD